MSLFSSMQLASNTLRTNEIALQVAGQNIANSNTPGYIREEVQLTPAATQRNGKLLLGLGVQVEAVVQKIDRFLEERLRGAVSERVNAETQENAFAQLEGVIGEMSDTDLSTILTSFFSSVADILNQPESVSVRNLAALQGVTVSREINRLYSRTAEMRSDLNDRIIDMSDNINRLTHEIRDLNIKIADTEGGNTSASDAVGLRDQRLIALEELAELINIRIQEQPSGGLVVYSGGDFLVFEGIAREVEVVLDSDRGLSIADIHLVETDAPLDPTGGELRGLLDARDQVMGGFLSNLDDFAQTLAFEFNKLYSRGQGLRGFEQVTSEFQVDDVDEPLSAAGLDYTPENGAFQIMVHNTQTEQTLTTDIVVDLNGFGQDLTLEDLAEQLDAVEGLAATTTADKRLSITTVSDELEFAFAGDTSGVLAALGINTFFSGTGASNLGVSEVVRDDPAKFAASAGGIRHDTENAIDLAAFLDFRIESKNSASLSVLYDQMIGETTQASSITRAEADGARVFEETLRGQKLAISGVSLDEEAVRMIAFQRAYQASARYIATLDELFEILVSL